MSLAKSCCSGILTDTRARLPTQKIPSMNDRTPIRLYQGTTSSASWRVRIALALKEIEYQPVWLDLGRDDHLTEHYTAITPIRQVPCLEIDGRRLFQSVAIIEYLDETRPQPPLLPTEPQERAVVRGLTEVMNSLIQPLHNRLVRERLQEQFGVAAEQANAWSRYWIERRFADLNRALARTCGRFSHGDRVSMVDVFLFPQVETAARFHVDGTKFPNIGAVMEHLNPLPAFANSYPPE